MLDTHLKVGACWYQELLQGIILKGRPPLQHFSLPYSPCCLTAEAAVTLTPFLLITPLAVLLHPGEVPCSSSERAQPKRESCSAWV